MSERYQIKNSWKTWNLQNVIKNSRNPGNFLKLQNASIDIYSHIKERKSEYHCLQALKFNYPYDGKEIPIIPPLLDKMF